MTPSRSPARTGVISVRRWGLVSAPLAPVALVVGWTIAARLQPVFDARSGTISALASLVAADRWVMTVALVVTGSCHMATAAALAPVATPGRLVLAVGGLATVAVAAFPLPTETGRSTMHTISAALAFGCLALWPLLAGPRDKPVWVLRLTWRIIAAVVLGGLVVVFYAALKTAPDVVGLTERLAAGAQAVWPAVVVAALVVGRRRQQAVTAGRSPSGSTR